MRIEEEEGLLRGRDGINTGSMAETPDMSETNVKPPTGISWGQRAVK